MKKSIRITLLLVLFLAVSCQNSGNNTTETFTLESTITPANAGTVSPSGGSFDSGEQFQITATPNNSFVFKEWNGDLSGSDNPASITITKNMSINALFEQLTYPLTVDIEGEGGVTEQIVNAKTDYVEGTTVQLTAEPNDEWRFVEWSGDLDGTSNPVIITMNSSKEVNARFEFGFNETFEDGEAQNWLFSDNEFSIQDGKLQYFIERGINHGSAYYNQPFKNFKVETRFSQQSQREESIIVIYIRSTGFLIQDEENEIFSEGYFMTMNTNGVLIAKAEQVGDEVESEFFYEAEIDLAYGENEYHTLVINANGSNFDFFLDGDHIHSFSDDTFTDAGYITIATVNVEEDKNYQTSWDYVKVLPPDPPRKN